MGVDDGWHTEGAATPHPELTPSEPWAKVGRCWDGADHSVGGRDPTTATTAMACVLEPVEVPADIVVGLLAYLRALGLHYGAFDFVITPQGEWVMLECNPSGQCLWLHHLADLPIPAAMAELLIGESA